MAAQEVMGVEDAFSFLKQTPLDVRMAAERRIKRKVQAILKAYKEQAAQSIQRGEPFNYDGMADELRAAVLPELTHLVVDNTLRLSVETGIGFDPAVINTEALRWAREWTDEWEMGITNTTRNQIREALSAFVQTPGMTIGDIEALIEPTFGSVRAEMIAVTETTRAYSEATNELQKLLQAEIPELTPTRVWGTANDELVCFPAWTMVDTATELRPIQSIKPGEWVCTRVGHRRVAEVSERSYGGPMVYVATDSQSVLSTANHPYWTLEQEWVEGRNIKIGHTLEVGKGHTTKARHVVGVVFDQPIQVYNLQVEGTPEFYANGVLVHNCPICGPLEGAPEAKFTEEGFPNGPPAHVNCVLPGNVVAVPGLIAGAQSTYVGKAIEVTTAGGRCLTVTENHPILTNQGWIEAKYLSKAVDVVICTTPEWIASSVYPDDHHMPAAIEEVFGALKMSEAVVSARVPSTTEDFHGDGRNIYGNINVVGPYSFLLGDIETRLSQLLSESSFDGNGTDKTLFIRNSVLAFLSPGDSTSTAGTMSSRDLIATALGGHTGPFEQFGSGVSTGFDPVGNQNAFDSRAVNTKLAAEFIRRFASLIATDKIVSVRKFDFSGHVYDLQSGLYGLYTVNGIVSSNCRCGTTLTFAAPERIEAEFRERQAERDAYLRELERKGADDV